MLDTPDRQIAWTGVFSCSVTDPVSGVKGQNVDTGSASLSPLRRHGLNDKSVPGSARRWARGL